MKRLIAIIALTSMIACVGCGEKDEVSTSTSSSSSSTTESSTISESTTISESKTVEESSENESSVAESTAKEEDYFDWWGLNMYRPADYQVKMSEGFPQAFLSTADDTVNNIVYLTLKMDDITTAEGALDYFYKYSVNKDILGAEDKVASVKDNEIVSEEKVQVNGCDFIRQSGVYHCDTVEQYTDFAYTGYFGVMDFPKLGKQPAVFIAFSHHTDDESKAELERLVDTIAKDAKPIA